MSYIERIIEDDLLEKLSASGAVLIKGPKSCGKTATATQYAKSILEMDRDPQVPVIMATNPQLLLAGNTPRLIDEWQEHPEIWNYVRHEVDDRKAKGQFILTGSANPTDDVKLHSGAGRFTVVQKRNGNYAAFEIKLGVGYIDEAAENLKRFAGNIDTSKMDLPKSLNIITGTGMSYRRPDAINVISLASLGR